GDLLEDAPFEEWVLLNRERLQVQHLETLDRVARMRFDLGRYTGCIEACQRLVTGDLCREDMHRLLMPCYARLNKPHLAVHQYHQCERQLRDELGLKPADATRVLYDRIRQRQLVLWFRPAIRGTNYMNRARAIVKTCGLRFRVGSVRSAKNWATS